MDFVLEGTVDEPLLHRMEGFGTLLLLRDLREPFYKIESAGMIIRGILGHNVMRVALPRESIERLDEVEEILRDSQMSI